MKYKKVKIMNQNLSNKENNQIEKNESDIILPKSKNESVNQEKKESEKIPSRNEKTSELNNLLLDSEKDLQTKKEEENKENKIIKKKKKEMKF